MSNWLQRIRGAVGMGVTWAAGWAPIGALAGIVLHAVLPSTSIELGTVVVLNATTFAGLGFLGGTIFAAVLRLTEGKQRFDALSVPGFAAWGALGGALLGGIAVTAGLWGAGSGLLAVGLTGAATMLGAGSAVGSLVLARRAGDRDLITVGAVARLGVPGSEQLQVFGQSSELEPADVSPTKRDA
jgi:hypothetical protein